MRICKRINDNWMFKKEGEKPINISLPHTWNGKDGQDGGNDYYRGRCIYEKKLEMPPHNSNDRVYLEFRGVNSSARVKINNTFCGEHHGGYSTFRVDITSYLKDENLIEVMVDNSPNDKVYPQRADFTFYGGIYRDVYLVILPESHFDMDYYGGPGIKVTPKIKGKDAEVELETYIRGVADFAKLTIKGVGSVDCQISYDEEGKGYARGSITISGVHLWNGIKDPYLYEGKAGLIVDGKVIDEVKTSFGCRSYSFDPEKGFILNGKTYPLHGVSRHQDRKGAGNAITKEMHKEDMELILEMGANAIRLAHYQHDQYFYDLCDEKGIIVWAEIPYISEHLPMARENTISQLKELIIQNYNHPSIICWGLSNEISLTGVTDDMIENHNILNDLAHKLDPSRVTTMAHLFMLETDNPLVDLADIMSYNLYYGWYVGGLEENDKFFDDFHEKYPNKIIGLSEYGADAYHKLQSPNPRQGDYSEQYQGIYHEHMLEMFAKRPYLWSTFVWNMFDFAADGRDEAGDPGINHKGLISFDRKVKKDAFYIYKAWWSKEAFVHLCGKRYVDRVEEETEIKVYSNQNKVELYMDGNLVGEKTGDHIFTFKVKINGEHHIEVRSGELYDRMKIQKVDKPNPEYFMSEHFDVTNWFEEPEMEVIPGYYSIKDTLEEINQSPRGKALFEKVMEQATSSLGNMAENVEITDSMKEMMNRLTVEQLLQQAGSMIYPEMVKGLNKELNKIKKEK